MILKMILSAMFKLRNIGLFLIALGAAAIAEGIFPALPWEGTSVYIALGVYALFVIQTLGSKEFHKTFNLKQKIRQIKNLDRTTYKLMHDAKRYVNSTYYQRLQRVVRDKNEIVDSFMKGERNYLKERIVEQTLKLVISYIKLLMNFCMRSKQLSKKDVGAITERINTNTRKLNFAKDPYAADDIKKVIEMDEKIIVRMKEEKSELERISTKLDYMESTVNMFKNQILSSIESEEMLEQLDSVVNEAEALDSALDSVLDDRRKRNHMRL